MLPLNAAFFYATINLYDRKESRMRFSDDCPLVLMKEGGAMDTMEVLTLLLLIFSALSYIDNHKKK